MHKKASFLDGGKCYVTQMTVVRLLPSITNKKFLGGQEGPMTLTMTVNTQWYKLHNDKLSDEGKDQESIKRTIEIRLIIINNRQVSIFG